MRYELLYEVVNEFSGNVVERGIIQLDLSGNDGDASARAEVELKRIRQDRNMSDWLVRAILCKEIQRW